MTAITMPSPTAKLSFGGVIQGTFGVLKRNFATFLILITICLAPAALIVGWGVSQLAVAPLKGGGLIALGYLTLMVGSAVLNPAIVHASVSDMNGRRVTVGEGVEFGFQHAAPVFAVFLLMWLGCVAGMILLIVPGIMLLMAWLVAAPAQVVEKIGVFKSFSRSSALTKNNRWRLFGLLMLYSIVMNAVQQVLLNLAGVSTFGTRTMASLPPAYWGVIGFSSLVGALIMPTALAVIYFELRRVKEGVGPEALAAVFD